MWYYTVRYQSIRPFEPNMNILRVAHMLDTRGASMVVDTGCASGLAASHLARLAIEKGDTQLAIVVTTNLIGWK